MTDDSPATTIEDAVLILRRDLAEKEMLLDKAKSKLKQVTDSWYDANITADCLGAEVLSLKNGIDNLLNCNRWIW